MMASALKQLGQKHQKNKVGWRFACLGLAGVLILFSPSTFSYTSTLSTEKLREPHVSNRVLLKRKASTKNYISGINNYLGARKVDSLGGGSIELVSFTDEHSIQEALFLYGLDPSVEFVEPDFLFFASEVVPDDTNFGSLWGLQNDGSGGGVADVDINAPLLWETSIGDAGVVVGVLDTGVNYSHPDLSTNMWQNPGEIPGNGIDDDGNGYIDDIYGINAITNSGDPVDDNGHGSHVVGVIAGVGNNATGIAGVMHNAKVVSCKFLGAGGSGATSDAIKCLDYFLDLKTRAQNPVDIVATNNSWASSVFSQGLLDVIKLHLQEDIAFVAAADNYGINNDHFDTYPANYEVANVISVGAVDRAGELASFSNYGKHSVHIAAPGKDILSTYIGSSYASLNGTSMAAPYVTGVISLLSHAISANTMIQNKNLIISSKKSLASLVDKSINGGMLRAADVGGVGAISCVDQNTFQTTGPKSDMVSIALGDELNVRVLNINCADPAGDFSATLNPGGHNIDFVDDGVEPDASAIDGVYSANVTPPAKGAYDLDLDGKYTVEIETYDAASWNSYRFRLEETYSYIDFVGTKIEMEDDDVFGIKSPFLIPFGQDSVGLSHVYIGSNGTISLSDNTILDFENKSLPLENFTSVIAPLWVDLDASQAGVLEGVFYEVMGAEPSRKLVVEYRDMKHYSASGKVTFQVVFSEDNHEIIFSYKTLDFNDITHDGGASANIGIQVRDMGANLDASYIPIADESTFSVVYNEAPSANAGDDKSISKGQALNLDGSLSFDLENQPALSYSWQQLSGPAQSISNDDTAMATIINAKSGTSIFELRVMDDGGAYASDTITLSVSSGGSGGGGGGGGSSSTTTYPPRPPVDQPVTAAVNTAPAPPSIILRDSDLKLDNTSGLNLVVKNSTDAENDPLTYEFEIHSVADFTNLVFSQIGISSHEGAYAILPVPNLAPNATYFWRARAFDGELSSPWSSGQFRLVEDEPKLEDASAGPPTSSGCSTRQNNSLWLILAVLLPGTLARTRRRKSTGRYI